MPDCKKYDGKDFTVNRLQSRTYGSGENTLHLVYVNIKNNITGEEFEDWVRPNQIRDKNKISDLICWK